MTDARELYEHRRDEEEWDEEPADVRTRPSATEVVSFRMASEELDRVQEAAARHGASLSEFIRAALHQALEGSPVAELDDVYIGPIKVILGAEWRRRVTRHTASSDPPAQPMYQVIPDYPPSSQNMTSSEGAEPIEDSPRLPLDA